MVSLSLDFGQLKGELGWSVSVSVMRNYSESLGFDVSMGRIGCF